MKKFLQSLIPIPVIYAGFMLFKQPSLADSFIVVALCALSISVMYLKARYVVPESNAEAKELHEQLEVERLKNTIENLKTQAARERALRDNQSAGGNNVKQFKF